jgi:hypothetical protein
MYYKIGIVVITLLLLVSGCISGTLPKGIFHENKSEDSTLLNTSNRLSVSIPDPYGYNQFNHPDVYYNASGVFGHKWWMFITPFPYSNGTSGNACLYYSDDGLLWHVPSGVTNPIGKPIVSAYDSNAYASYPDIVYDPITRKLMCYYVIGDVVGNVTIEDPKVRTYDGSTVSSEMNVTAHGISPAVLYDNSTGTYYMWIVDIDPKPHIIYRYTSIDGVHFSNKQVVGQSSDYQPWLINMMNYPGNSTIYALFRFKEPNDNLYLATANNYTDNFTVQGLPLLQTSDPSCAMYKDIQLDRSAGVFSDDGNFLKLWIPAKDTNGIWTLFYTQATQENGVWTVDKGVNKYPTHGVIYWKGLNWYVIKGRSDPINNHWNNTGAWIDDKDRMHLTIVKDGDIWNCTMLNSQYKYRYGTFTWKVASPIYTFDNKSVVGFFTYLDDNNELDIEASTWGKTNGDQLTYTVQPTKTKGNAHAYAVPDTNGTNTTYTLEWKPTYVRFTSKQENGKIIADYNYTNVSGIPQDPANILMNLWLWDWNQPPTDGKNIELIVSDFTITNGSNEIDLNKNIKNEYIT